MCSCSQQEGEGEMRALANQKVLCTRQGAFLRVAVGSLGPARSRPLDRTSKLHSRMKRISGGVVLLWLLAECKGAAIIEGTPSNTAPYTVIERGVHQRVWQQIVWQTNALNQALATTNSYKELEIGMHRKGPEGEWIECSSEIQIQPDGGAAATNVQHRLYLPGSLYIEDRKSVV